MEVKVGKYIHTKGGLYLVDRVEEGLVYYDPLYPVPDENDPKREQPKRTIEEFAEIVEKGSERLPRFRLLENTPGDQKLLERSERVIELLTPTFREQYGLARPVLQLPHLYFALLAFAQGLDRKTIMARLDLKDYKLGKMTNKFYATVPVEVSTQLVEMVRP